MTEYDFECSKCGHKKKNTAPDTCSACGGSTMWRVDIHGSILEELRKKRAHTFDV